MSAGEAPPTAIAIPVSASNAPYIPLFVIASIPWKVERKIVIRGTKAINIWKRLAGVTRSPQAIKIYARPIVIVPKIKTPNNAFPLGNFIRLYITMSQCS